MALPEWNDLGLLPVGAHQADLPDIYERLVLDAPNRERREMLFSALSVYLQRAKEFSKSGTAWINGGFAMKKSAPPHDVDIVWFPADWAEVENLPNDKRKDMYGLFTLQDVIVGSPGPEYFDRIQPIGGALDGFLSPPENKDYWFELWSAVKDNGEIIEGAQKGFVEVVW